MEAWRELRVGDRIRLVSEPAEWQDPAYTVPACTRSLVRRLIGRGRSLRISEVDEQGVPWVHCMFRDRSGHWEHHHLAIIEGGWVRVRSRASTRSR